MGEAEIESWINQVFVSIKRVAGGLFRIKPSPQRELQIVVNASYQLITLMNAEACKQEIFHQYYSYLVYLCQRTCLAPSTYLLNPADVTIDHSDSLGCGATSDIYRCTVRGIEAVAKTYRVFKGINKRDTRHFLKEALLLRLIIPHPHILPSLGVIMSPNALQIISPLMRNGSIVKYTKKHPNVSKKELLEQVADGLHFLHQYNVVHGDLKGDNILITDDGKACIADLGSSNFMELSQPLKASSSRPIVAFQSFATNETIRSESTATNDSAISSLSGMSVFSAAGTTRYMAPERLFPEKHGAESARATPPSDVFSFGMLAWEVYSGKVPFSEVKVPAYAAQKILKGHRPPKPRTMTYDLWKLVQSCWKKSAHTRPTIHSIYNELATMP
ncbi:kinase-like protein [Pholiota conissans]|uniref:Kinase-like protein n=1 Tax=Pholiota conissans TaxID=109636 RepID=A0A9P6CWG8_9AGAR|nr:kinase-like protein [Pholiota conissans]